MQQIVCSRNEHWGQRDRKQQITRFLKCFVFSLFVMVMMCDVMSVCAGDAGANSGEDIQLTTTITHVDAPTEIYKMVGKTAQE